MRSSRFTPLAEQLLAAGIAPRHARRTVFELTGHFEDLVAELQAQGATREDAEAEALARLNPEALVAAAIARPELHSWVRRWPLASCTVLPLAMYVAFVVGSIALMIGCATVLQQNFGVSLASSRELQRFASLWMSGIMWAIPVFAAGTFCSLALSRRIPVRGTLVGATLISILGALLNAGLLLPPDARPAFQAGLGFSAAEIAEPLLRAALTLAIVLPIYFWRRAVHLGRARELSASQVIAIGAVLVLHMVFFSLLSSARAPRLESPADDPAMTWIVVPPVVEPRTLTGSSLPSRSPQNTKPTAATPGKTAAATEQRAPIDWTREAARAVTNQVAAIELERRRARGFTPQAQNREPEIKAAPAPGIAWSRTAQRVEPLPEGGILIHLSERCALVVSVMLIPMCGFGEIPANGALFEHMDDPPTLGDWKDDSAERR